MAVMNFNRPFLVILLLSLFCIAFWVSHYWHSREASLLNPHRQHLHEADQHHEAASSATNANAIKGVIYLMVGLEYQLAGAMDLLFQLEHNLLVKYPVIIFFDDPTLAPALEMLRARSEKLEVNLHQLKFEVPEFVPKEKVVEEPAGFTGKIGSVGYRHMCRFYSGDVFNLKVLREYDYAWRLDPGFNSILFQLNIDFSRQ